MLVSGSPSITEQKHHPAARVDRTHRWQVAIDEVDPLETAWISCLSKEMYCGFTTFIVAWISGGENDHWSQKRKERKKKKKCHQSNKVTKNWPVSVVDMNKRKKKPMSGSARAGGLVHMWSLWLNSMSGDLWEILAPLWNQSLERIITSKTSVWIERVTDF